MNELFRLYEQCVAWLIVTWDWVVAMLWQLWQRIPYHAVVTTTFQRWYGAGYLTIAVVVLAVLWLLVVVRQWAVATVNRTHYNRFYMFNVYLLRVIRLGRDDVRRDEAAITAARRTFKQYFYTYQLDFTDDSDMRRAMRELVNQVDEDAALFHQKVELKRAYALHALVESQCNAFPRRIRWLYRLTGSR